MTTFWHYSMALSGFSLNPQQIVEFFHNTMFEKADKILILATESSTSLLSAITSEQNCMQSMSNLLINTVLKCDKFHCCLIL